MDKNESVKAVPMQEEIARQFRPVIFLLMGAVALVLLIGCANLANLMLARAIAAQRALATRLALGATRWRLVRQLLTESLVLAGIGAVIGLLVAYWGVQGVIYIVSTNIPDFSLNPSEMSIVDWRVLLFTVSVSVVTGALFGMFPAAQLSRPDLSMVFQSGGRGGTGQARRRTHSILVVAEVGLALVLLISATLLIRTIRALRAVDPGFDSRNVLIMQTSLAGSTYNTNRAIESLSRRAVERLESIPGVLRASPAVAAPLIGIGLDLPFTIEGKPPGGGDRYNGDEQWRFVGPNYFATLSVPVRKGRAFTESDNAAAAKVVIINEAMAKKYWANENPLGRRITIGHGLGLQFEDPPREIVGIVADVREAGFNKPAPPVMYVPMNQMSDALIGFGNSVLPTTWIVRTASSSTGLATTIRREFASIDSQLAVANVRPLNEANLNTLANENISTNLLTVFAAIALVLASVGIYGLVSHAVQQRTQEIGVRLSLGATPADVYKLILGQAMKLALAGVLLGVAGAIGLTRFLSSVLFGVRPADPPTFVIMSIVLAAIALLAAYVPARRAISIKPVVALREV